MDQQITAIMTMPRRGAEVPCFGSNNIDRQAKHCGKKRPVRQRPTIQTDLVRSRGSYDIAVSRM